MILRFRFVYVRAPAYPQIRNYLPVLSKEGLSVSRAAWRNSVVIGMQFCPKCGLALTPTKKQKIVVLTCPKCGQESKRYDPVIQKLEKAKESIVVIGKGKNIQTLPTMKVSCQKCGHGEAFYWMVQTRGGDEASTQFFRCTKCGQHGENLHEIIISIYVSSCLL